MGVPEGHVQGDQTSAPPNGASASTAETRGAASLQSPATEQGPAAEQAAVSHQRTSLSSNGSSAALIEDGVGAALEAALWEEHEQRGLPNANSNGELEADTEVDTATEIDAEGQRVPGEGDQALAEETHTPVTIDATAADSSASKEERVRLANLEFLNRVSDALSLPISVLLEQRDRALGQLAEFQARSDAERARIDAEHERFVSYLMEEQLAAVRHLREELESTREELQRARTLAVRPAPGGGRSTLTGDIRAAQPSDGASQDESLDVTAPDDAFEQIEKLRAELEAAYSEVDEIRADAGRLQDERDEAIRSTDDVRLELQAEIDAVKDETFDVQTQLDRVLRQLDDARDEARDEALRLNEELDEVRRELDERNDEVRRLRGRLEGMTDEVVHSRPPPPAPASELEQARREVKWLRQQLIDAKRQLSRAGRTEVQRAQRPLPRSPRAAESEPRQELPSEGSLQAPKVPDVS